jgi:hypothetical protein
MDERMELGILVDGPVDAQQQALGSKPVEMRLEIEARTSDRGPRNLFHDRVPSRIVRQVRRLIVHRRVPLNLAWC